MRGRRRVVACFKAGKAYHDSKNSKPRRMKAHSTRRKFVGGTALAGAGAALVPDASGAGASPVSPLREFGCDAALLERADRLIAEQVASGAVWSAAVLVRRGAFEFVRAHGRAAVHTPFLIASPTKPMTASAVLLLLDRGELKLVDPVQKYLPQFRGGERAAVTIQHLLTHTSGLPDMLPENVELRKRHAPLSEFVAGTCRTELLFRPGTKVSYQSMGILLAGAVVERISDQSLPAFLAANVFGPLKLSATSLGLGGRKISDTALCQVDVASDWDWNSAYWRNLGTPWGGAHSTVRDLAGFAEQFVATENRPWTAATRLAMRSVQTGGLNQAWGLGWLMEPRAFGQSCAPGTFGHFGATGTVLWHDPVARLTCVLLTTRPAADSRAGLLGPVSDLVAQSVRA